VESANVTKHCTVPCHSPPVRPAPDTKVVLEALLASAPCGLTQPPLFLTASLSTWLNPSTAPWSVAAAVRPPCDLGRVQGWPWACAPVLTFSTPRPAHHFAVRLRNEEARSARAPRCLICWWTYRCRVYGSL
jgi:hypothetical protein